MFYFNNPYLYIFINLFVFYHLAQLFFKFPYVTRNQSNVSFLKAFDNYYLSKSDRLFAFFAAVLYVILNCLPFILLRISLLGVSRNVYFTQEVSVYNIISIIFFMIDIIYYLKIVNLIFYPYMIKVHIYLFRYEFYFDLGIFIRDLDHVISGKFLTFSLFFWKLNDPKEKFLRRYKKNLRKNKKIFQELAPENVDKFKRDTRLHFNLWSLCNKYKILSKLAKCLEYTFNYLRATSFFLYHVPHTCLIIVVFYDIQNGMLYYTFYMLLIFYITNIIKKIRRFYYIKDYVHDAEMSRYFYQKENPCYSEVRSDILKLDDKRNTSKLGKNIYNMLYSDKDEIIDYILVDFHVYYIIEPLRKANYINLLNIYKRNHILLLLMLLIIYLIYYNKYIIYLFTFQVPLSYICVLLALILAVYIRSKFYKNIIIDTSDPHDIAFGEWIANKKYHWFFRILIIIISIPLLYIALKNKLTIFPNEILYEINHWFYIEEIFSLEDKKDYIHQYIEYIGKASHFTEDSKKELTTSMYNHMIMKKKITFEQIREFISKESTHFVKNNDNF